MKALRRSIGSLLFLVVVFLQQHHAAADCSACDPKNGGHCETAWRGQPGQFCGHWRDWGQTLPCCCPLNAECAVTTNHCGCRRISYVHKPGRQIHRHEEGSLFSSPLFWVFLLLALSCCCCGWRLCSRETGEPVYRPVTQYYATGTSPPLATSSSAYQYGEAPTGYPIQPSAPLYSPGGGGSGRGYTGGEVLGAGAAGLATGALLGSLFSSNRGERQREDEESYYFEGDATGGGGAVGGDGVVVEEFEGDF